MNHDTGSNAVKCVVQVFGFLNNTVWDCGIEINELTDQLSPYPLNLPFKKTESHFIFSRGETDVHVQEVQSHHDCVYGTMGRPSRVGKR